MKKIFTITIILASIYIIINNYSSGIDQNYPMMQFGFTLTWMIVSILLYLGVKKSLQVNITKIKLDLMG